MSIRRLAALAAIAALGLLALGSASASATTALRTDPGGALLTGTTTIKNNASDPAVLTTAAGNITCNQTFFDATVTSNSGATISGSLQSLTFTTCTDTLLAVNIVSCNRHAALIPTVTITSNGTGGSVALGHTVVRCQTSTPNVACYYTAANAAGTATNSNSSINFPSVSAVAVAPTTDAAPVGNCGSTGTFRVTLTHVVNAAGATVTVTTS